MRRVTINTRGVWALRSFLPHGVPSTPPARWCVLSVVSSYSCLLSLLTASLSYPMSKASVIYPFTVMSLPFTVPFLPSFFPPTSYHKSLPLDAHSASFSFYVLPFLPCPFFLPCCALSDVCLAGSERAVEDRRRRAPALPLDPHDGPALRRLLWCGARPAPPTARPHGWALPLLPSLSRGCMTKLWCLARLEFLFHLYENFVNEVFFYEKVKT